MLNDNPIRGMDEDVLGRARSAEAFAKHVLALDASEGVVVAVLGPWGSGKTSFINLSRGAFQDAGISILDFNPWMFSGTEQLVESFFVELASQMRLRPGLTRIGEQLEAYGESFSGIAWLPLVGPWIERSRGAAKILGTLLQRRKEGLSQRRTTLSDALAQLGTPIVIVIDDIDRLSTAEIRDVFKLVRLTVSFPNLIYIAAFDRLRVEEALGEQGVPGRAYLEKILQIAVDLPKVPDQALSQQLIAAVDDVISSIEHAGPFQEHVWPDVFMEVIRPLIRNMRDVKRYAIAIQGTVVRVEGQIALVDVLGLEAIRVFLPDVFGAMQGAVDGLTTTSGWSGGSRDEPPYLKSQVENIFEAAPEHRHVAQAMINRLFPAASRHVGGSHFGSEWTAQWLRERRIAHKDILRLYLDHVAGESLLAFTDAENAWSKMADPDGLDEFLRSIDRDRLEDVVESLETFEDQFNANQVVPSTIVLLNLLPELPERRRGMFDLDSRFKVSRVTYRLLRSLKDPPAVEAAVRSIYPEVHTLSSKLSLITQVGHRENAGHKLVSEEAGAELESMWRTEVRSSLANIDLAREYDLLRVLYLTQKEADSSEPRLQIPASPEATLAILRAARSEVRSQPMDSRAIRRSQRLGWDVLVELYGGEVVLAERIETLRAAELADGDDLLQLAQKYLSGWRPRDFDDDE